MGFRIRGKVLVLAGIIVLVCIGVGVYFAFRPKSPSWEVSIATGTPGGTYYNVGGQLALLLQSLPDVKKAYRLKDSQGAVHNIEDGQRR